MKITMDGRTYELRVKLGTLEESFRIEDGPNAGTMLSGDESRDVVGTYYEHSMAIEPDPRHYQDYIDFYTAISAPVDSHRITMPHAGGTITYDAMVVSGAHSIRDTYTGTNRYTGLTVFFKAKGPQVIPS